MYGFEAKFLFKKKKPRVMQPGRPGKVGEFYVWLKNQRLSAFYPKFLENQEVWENLRLEAVIMTTLKPNFWVSCHI